MFHSITKSTIGLMAWMGILCGLCGCADQSSSAAELRAAENGTDADVREYVKRYLATPHPAAWEDPSFRRLMAFSFYRGPTVVEELLRQGTKGRTEFNSNDDPFWQVLTFLRLGVLRWDDTFPVAADLMKSGDPHLKESAKFIVGYLLEVTNSELQDSTVVAYLKNHTQDQNAELIQLLIQAAPERGLRILSDAALMSSEESRVLLWAGHLIEETIWREDNHFSDKLPNDKQAAIEQLRLLAGRSEWWARYYAATMLYRYATLVDPATKEKLKNDPDPRVREALDPPPAPPDPEPPTPRFPVIGRQK